MLLIFLIVLGVIAKWVVPPVSKVLRERDAMVKNTAEDNRAAADQFAAADQDYQAVMAKARGEASKFATRPAPKGARSSTTCGAGLREVASMLQQADSELKEQALSIKADLQSSVETLSETLASRVLGVEINTATSASGR